MLSVTHTDTPPDPRPLARRRGGLMHRLLTVLDPDGRRARSDGFWAGRAAERARILRTLHDTVLQDLEAMSLASDLDRVAPAAALAELRGVARCRAVRLRQAMSELVHGEPGSLLTALNGVVSEFVAAGVRVEFVAAQRLPEPTPARGQAVRQAVREALGNVAKHAGVRHAVLRMDTVDGGIEVVVRDNGTGFDTARVAPGFGIQQSILSRISEVGGSAGVTSWPGRGTRVRLWVPQ